TNQHKPEVQSTENDIKKVETSLVAPVFFEGDSMWTIEERMKHYGVPGVSIAIIKDNKIECIKSYGVMDKESKAPVTTNTLFQAASVSKPVSAYGALRLVEQKKLDLNENINTYLTSWKLPDNEFTKDKKATIKGLLSHTAGITVHGFLGYSPDLPVPTLIEVLDGKKPANSDPICVDKAPGGDFRYSGGGYCIMQQIMIDKEGKPFPQIMNDFVFQPLGMSNSTFNQPLQAEQLKMAATGYIPDGTQTKGKRHTYPEMAPAGLWTTAEDLAKFAIDVQKTYKGESNVVISKEMVATMLTPVTGEGYGLGFGIMNSQKDDVYFQHNGWNEGFCSQLVAHKEKGYGAVILINSNQPKFMDELTRAIALTYKWDNYFPSYKKMELTSEEINNVLGRYYYHKNHKRIFIQLIRKDNKLCKYKFGGDTTELFKVADNTFVGNDSELIQFKRGENSTSDSITVKRRFQSSPSYTFGRLKSDEKLAFEFLIQGKFEEALAGFQKMKKEDPLDEVVQEDNLNMTGYTFLGANKIKLAKDAFKINTLLYPFSSNVYDSYAEACMKNNDLDLAIENYKISLKLNPKNTNATKMIEELQKKKSGK
ncbi:MAG TPA: serine hydrolase, partial [Bacteroidia bacterium]|nr:serine hydrolase [Bacteroidia bacterium]